MCTCVDYLYVFRSALLRQETKRVPIVWLSLCVCVILYYMRVCAWMRYVLFCLLGFAIFSCVLWILLHFFFFYKTKNTKRKHFENEITCQELYSFFCAAPFTNIFLMHVDWITALHTKVKEKIDSIWSLLYINVTARVHLCPCKDRKRDVLHSHSESHSSWENSLTVEMTAVKWFVLITSASACSVRSEKPCDVETELHQAAWFPIE